MLTSMQPNNRLVIDNFRVTLRFTRVAPHPER